MVETEHAHASWLVAPNVRILDDRPIVRTCHLGVKVDAVTARQRNTDAPPDAWLLTRCYLIDREAEIRDALFESVEISIASDFEGYEVDARRICFA